jgi:hypothetical protein
MVGPLCITLLVSLFQSKAKQSKARRSCVSTSVGRFLGWSVHPLDKDHPRKTIYNFISSMKCNFIHNFIFFIKNHPYA